MRNRLRRHPVLFLLILCVATLMTGSEHSQATVQDKNGPALGETIDLNSWRTRDGRTLAKVNEGHSLAMVLLVNPSCGTCISAKEDFRTLRERAGKPRIPYYVLMIPDSSDAQKYFSYVDSLKLGAEAFVWSNAEVKPLPSLVTMAVPSHLLVTNEGLIVEKWPGTTPN